MKLNKTKNINENYDLILEGKQIFIVLLKIQFSYIKLNCETGEHFLIIEEKKSNQIIEKMYLEKSKNFQR